MKHTERWRAWQWVLSWFTLGAVIVVGAALRFVHFGDVPSRSPDERVYTYFAGSIVEHGLSATPTLFAEYESESENWNYPPPTRIGHVILVAAAMNVSGIRDERAGTAVSLLFSCLSLLLVAWIGVRFFNPWVSVIAVVFLASSVGELGMARRAWQDSAFGFFGLLLVYLTCEITRNPRRYYLYPAFLAVGAYCLLTKQTGVIAYGLCALWLLGYLIFGVKWVKQAALLAAGNLISIAASIAVWSLLAGRLTVALSALNHSVHPGIRGLSYLQKCCTGPWYQFFYLLWIVGPLTAALALVGTGITLFRARLDPVVATKGEIADPHAAGVAAVMTVGFFSYACFFPGMQCLRYVSPANGTYCLLAGFGLWYLLSVGAKAMSRVDYRALIMLVAVAVMIEAARDYHTFVSVVVRSGMDDLSVSDIRQVMGR